MTRQPLPPETTTEKPIGYTQEAADAVAALTSRQVHKVLTPALRLLLENPYRQHTAPIAAGGTLREVWASPKMWIAYDPEPADPVPGEKLRVQAITVVTGENQPEQQPEPFPDAAVTTTTPQPLATSQPAESGTG